LFLDRLIADAIWGGLNFGDRQLSADADLRVLVLGFMVDREQPGTVYACPQRSRPASSFGQ
jgi:hypothetical protein